MSITGVLFVFAITALYGVGRSPDSVAYLAAAKSLLAGDGFIYAGDKVYVNWPPLFPILLAGLGSLGINGVTGARFINALAFGGIVFGAGQLFRAHFRSNLLVIIGTVSILISPVLLRISIKVWSEPLFTLFVVWFFYFLSRFLNEKRITFLLFISVLAALATLQRYMGVTLVQTGVFSIAFAMRSVSLPKRFRYLIAFSLISVAPIGIWVTRNYALTSTLAGDRSYSYHTIFQSIGRTVETLTSWFIPNQIPVTAAVALVCVGSLILLGIVVGVHYKLDRRVNLRLETAWPAISYLLIYIVLLISLSTRVFDEIEFRLLAPVHVIIMLLFFLGVEAAARSLNRISRSNALGNGFVAGMVALGVISLLAQFMSLELHEQAKAVTAALQPAGRSFLP